MKKIWKFIAIALAAVSILSFAACGKTLYKGTIVVDIYGSDGAVAETKEIKFNMYKNYAPETVETMLKLIKDGYYSGTVFGEFVISPSGTSVYSFNLGKFVYNENGEITFNKELPYGNVKGEFEKGGWTGNPLTDTKGKLVMLKDGDTRDSATSHFAITLVSGQFPITSNCLFASITDETSLTNLEYLSDVSKYNDGSYDYEYYALRDGVLYYMDGANLYEHKGDKTSVGELEDDDEILVFSPNQIIVREIKVK